MLSTDECGRHRPAYLTQQRKRYCARFDAMYPPRKAGSGSPRSVWGSESGVSTSHAPQRTTYRPTPRPWSAVWGKGASNLAPGTFPTCPQSTSSSRCFPVHSQHTQNLSASDKHPGPRRFRRPAWSGLVALGVLVLPAQQERRGRSCTYQLPYPSALCTVTWLRAVQHTHPGE